jgi:glutathione peroxidase-family protein
LRFLEKVDVNGAEMHPLLRFLKRNSPSMFIPRYGMATRIHEPRNRFLMDRYGIVKYHYSPTVELAVVEQDILKLLAEEYVEDKWLDLIDPPDMFD